MKTEQEQIEKMARTMCEYCSTDGKCAVSKNLREPDICTNVDTQYCLYKEHAEQLVENGFGDVSEYKAEIEQLEAKNKVLKDGIVKAFTNGFNEGRKQVEKDIRRAKIDVLKELRERIETATDTYFNVDGGYCLAECVMNDIDELIEEIEK